MTDDEPSVSSTDRPRILYLAGAQHCGSTMLDAILGNAPGARSLGEVGGFHRYRDAADCDCGEPPASCVPCAAAVSALVANNELDAFHRLSPLPLKERRAWWTLFRSRQRAAYARVAVTIYSAVARATEATVLVDSSKNASRAAAIAHDSGLDVRVVHIVRDGRGYLRSKERRSDGRRLRPLPVALAPWLTKNLLIGVALRARLPAERYLVCRYEDLARDPEAELRRIGRFAGLDTGDLAAAATSDGLPRHHLFEPRRRVDYRIVRLDPSRLGSQREPEARNRRYWLAGGFVSRRWGYDRRQRYLDQTQGTPGS